jgi:hypothetical protein
MTKTIDLTVQDLEKFSRIDAGIWPTIDYLDFNSATYYFANDIPVEEIEKFCGEINGLRVAISIHFQDIHWDSLIFQKYRFWRACRKIEEYQEDDSKQTRILEAIRHYTYMLSEGNLPKDRLSLDEQIDLIFSKKVKPS